MAKFDAILFESGFAIGSVYYDDHYLHDDRQNRIVLTIEQERLKDFPIPVIVDTGAPWSILDPEVAKAWSFTSEVAAASLNIRGETRRGRLLRAHVILEATNGEDLTVEATFFVPFIDPDEVWNYPNFLGLNGFLDRFRFAVDASENAFYFGRF